MWSLLAVVLSQTPALTQFSGTWQLDPTASDDLAPLAKAAGVPSLVLLLAPKRPVQELRVADQTVIVTGTGPQGTHSERFTVDGPPTKGDLLGTPFEVSSTFSQGVLESTGTIEVEGQRRRFRLRRSVAGAVMQLTIEVGELTVKRVFTRQ